MLPSKLTQGQQMKIRLSLISEIRAGSERYHSYEDFETTTAIRLLKAWWHLPWNWPEPKLLNAQIWKLRHGLSDIDSLFRLRECLLRDLEVLRSLHFCVWFLFIFFSSALCTGRKYHSHLGRNPLLCHGPAKMHSYPTLKIPLGSTVNQPSLARYRHDSVLLLCTQIPLETKKHFAKTLAMCSCS